MKLLLILSALDLLLLQAVHLIKKTWRYPDWNNEGTSKLEYLKMSTLEHLVQEQFSDQAQRDSVKSSGQEQERTEQKKLCTRADDKSKLEISRVGSVRYTKIFKSYSIPYRKFGIEKNDTDTIPFFRYTKKSVYRKMRY
ncbi:hypothetical protein F511_30843 [Dorcoceras hygrometricum]|uniref:Uncharacterized protein n=1 Tax=Dorcoceras hygrometricum TaxID=472368 RepID=A0A2Z7AGH6_9LAMI|nr:hypothetical protein F511_30843 [Dorcoceras hygrometricum]